MSMRFSFSRKTARFESFGSMQALFILVKFFSLAILTQGEFCCHDGNRGWRDLQPKTKKQKTEKNWKNMRLTFNRPRQDSHRILRTVSVTVCSSITLLMAVQASTFVFNSGLAAMAWDIGPPSEEELSSRGDPSRVRARVGEGDPPRDSQFTRTSWPEVRESFARTPSTPRVKEGAGAGPKMIWWWSWTVVVGVNCLQGVPVIFCWHWLSCF